MALIRLDRIVKTYSLGSEGVQVLRGISLEIAAGEYVALMGASGSGKSTLMNILGFLDRPTSGSYFLEGRDMAEASKDEHARLRNEKIGFVFQSFNLLPRTSALDNVMMPLTYCRQLIPDHEAKRRAMELLTRVGLADRMEHVPSQLSGGQQQRVAIARALINNPTLLLADEPTGNLDSKTTVEVLDMFKTLHERDGITIVLVTHEPEVALQAKRIVKLKDGRIESDVKTERLGAGTEVPA
ncbi:MAG: ABC transporter ATP-binding protein [Deltaproteobacteria bacterium]|nr:ABC transporter ATP-binding protein [Deltaproteobacteria bacterium]